MRKIRHAIVPATTAAVVPLFAGCGGGQTVTADIPSADPTSPAQTAPPAKPQLSLAVTSPTDGGAVQTDSIVLRGKTEAGAKVIVAGHRAHVAHGGRWASQPIRLHLGSQNIAIKALKAGSTPATHTFTTTRRRNAAERAALQLKREQAIAQREADFKAGATTIPYNQLNKSADSYAGDHLTYRGQILQIQEDPAGGGMMLLSVTDEGYDIWDDNVWINYDGHVQSAEEDVITVYGVVKESKSYDTQAGGSTYVPEVDARYIDE